MQTILDIDDDVLMAIEERAKHQGTTKDKIVSDLIRQSLKFESDNPAAMRNGFELLPAGGKPVTVEMVQTLLDDEP